MSAVWSFTAHTFAYINPGHVPSILNSFHLLRHIICFFAVGLLVCLHFKGIVFYIRIALQYSRVSSRKSFALSPRKVSHKYCLARSFAAVFGSGRCRSIDPKNRVHTHTHARSLIFFSSVFDVARDCGTTKNENYEIKYDPKFLNSSLLETFYSIQIFG